MTIQDKYGIITDKIPYSGAASMEIQHTNFGSTSIIRCGIHQGKYDYHDHLHQFCEFVWVMEGEIEISVDGEVELAKAGDITVITPFRIHSFKTPDYCKIWICVVSNEFISSMPYDLLLRGRSCSVFSASDALSNFLVNLDFPNECYLFYKKRTEENYLHKLKAIFYLILSEYFAASQKSNRRSEERAISKILVYIASHYKENIDQNSVGKALGYSPRYISNCFKAIPGMNFRTMLNSMRIENAKAMLINTENTIIDIGLESGFSNERSFHRAFLTISGMTPGKYRIMRKIESKEH